MSVSAEAELEGWASIPEYISSGDFLAPGALIVAATVIFRVTLKLVDDEKDRIRLFYAVDETPWCTAYERLLASLSGVFDRFFGKYFSLQSFARCLFLAVIYTFCFSISAMEIVTRRTEENIIFAVKYLLLSLCLGFIIAFAASLFQNWIETAKKNREKLHRPWIGLDYAGYFLLAAGSATAAILTAHYLFRIDLSIAAAAAFVAIVVATGMVGGLGAGLISGAGTATGMLAVAVVLPESALIGAVVPRAGVVGFFTVAFTIGVFYPLINVLLDWPSWGVSRWLIRRLEVDARRRAWFAIVLHMVLDLALALLFLAALTAIFANIFAPMFGPTVAWRTLDIFRTLELDPWGYYLGMTLMILSTLVPTLIHLAAAVGALVVVPPPLRRFALGYLEELDPSTLERWVAAAYLTTWVMLSLGIAGTALYAILYYIPFFQGQTLWSLIFDIADYLVMVGD